MSLREQIIDYIKAHNKARPDDLANDLPFGRVAIHRNLKQLIEDGVLQKIGKAPTVFYILAPISPNLTSTQIDPEIKDFIDQDYLYITPQGNILSGYEGFSVWLQDTKQVNQTVHLAKNYVSLRQAYNQYRDANGWIDATERLKNTFSENMALDKAFLADFYSFAQFGKTKLGTLMLYAKQAQDRTLAKRVVLQIKPLIEKIITNFNIDAVAYIPPSVPRNIQFMNQLVRHLNLSIPRIALVKSRAGQVAVAQKTLEKFEQRVANARDTIQIKDAALTCKNILLIDDAIGSGATLNETAKKIRKMLPSKSKIIGFAIVGSYKGFDVIREV